jgi:hypothetical protein
MSATLATEAPGMWAALVPAQELATIEREVLPNLRERVQVCPPSQ